MLNLSLNTFKYAGKKYTFQAMLSYADDSSQYPIDNNALDLFEYSNEVNLLYLKGRLIATDNYGKFDKYLQLQYPFCYIMFIEHEQRFAGMFTLEKYSNVKAFYCKFYIDSFLILERNGPSVKYELKLVSENIFRCLANIDYTNYHKEPQSVFDILKACISATDSKIDKESFDAITTPVKLNYATLCNDNLLTITKYLLNRQYYYQDKDTSLKMLWYNETDLSYGLFDLKNKYQKSGVYSITLSFQNSNNESLSEPEQNKISTVVKFPTLKCMAGLKTHTIYDYDFKKNTFNDDCSIDTKTIVEYVNNKVNDDTLDTKAQQIKFSGLTYNYQGSYWNNDIAIYDTAIRSLIENNSLVVNTSGDILRKPTAYVNVLIDRDTKYVNSFLDLKSYKDKMTRYLGLEGMWFATRVTHIVEPKLAKYRQNLVLSRNFLPKFK